MIELIMTFFAMILVLVGCLLLLHIWIGFDEEYQKLEELYYWVEANKDTDAKADEIYKYIHSNRVPLGFHGIYRFWKSKDKYIYVKIEKPRSISEEEWRC